MAKPVKSIEEAITVGIDAMVDLARDSRDPVMRHAAAAALMNWRPPTDDEVNGPWIPDMVRVDGD